MKLNDRNWFLMGLICSATWAATAAFAGDPSAFSGCSTIGDPRNNQLRCCTLDVKADDLAHWCPADRIWTDPNLEAVRCPVGELRAPGRRWFCPPDPSATPSPSSGTTLPDPTTLPVPPAPAAGIDQDFPLVAGAYLREGGNRDARDSLDRARAKYGPVSTFLWQKTLYFQPQDANMDGLFYDAQVAAGTGFVPQISIDALQPQNYGDTSIDSLSSLRDRVCDSGSVLAGNLRGWAQFLRDKRVNIQFRPFSEMNVPDISYHLRRDTRADGAQLGQMWKCLRKIFRDQGASNVKFLIDVTGTLCERPENVTRDQYGNVEFLNALNAIDPQDVDAVGIHPYCRPPAGLVSAERMIAPWLAEIDRTAQRGKPIVIAEMGIDKGYSSNERARWICDAYEYARKVHHRIRNMTYFDQKSDVKDWTIDEGSAEHRAMREAISLGLGGTTHAAGYCAQTY